MTDNGKSGIALVAGSACGLVTMAIHPTAAGVATRAGYEHLALVSGAAHSIAIISVAVVFLGACGLTRRLHSSDLFFALAGLVAYGVAVVSALIAAAISGFVEPGIMLRMTRDVPAAAPQWHIVIDAVFQINQAFDRIFAIAASGAVFLWSAAALRNGRLGRGLAVYGCVLAPAIIAGVLIGHLRMDVHGFTAIVVAQASWFAAAGAQLYRAGEAVPAVAHT
jgi:hypothetical protein